MGFEVLETITKQNALPQAAISYMRPYRKDSKAGKDVKPKLVITVPTTICGLSKKNKFVLQIGSGDDGGKARISACGDKDKRAVTPVHMKYASRFNFGYAPKLGMDAAATEHVAVRKIDDDHFEIDLPDWFKL